MRTRALLTVGLLLGLAVLITPADALTRTVVLTANGPSPKSLTLLRGDRVQFRNDDTVPHQVRSEGPWQFDSGALPPGATSALTPVLTAPGTYRYVDNRGIIAPLARTFGGTLIVPAPKPTPKPTPSTSPAPKPTPTVQPSATPTAQPSATPTVPPTAIPTPLPIPTVTASPSPLPPSPTASPTPAPHIPYGEQRALVQGSPHRYGLPVLLAGVGIAAAASLLLRFLLSMPAGRRTED